MELVMLREHPMMSPIFYPALDKIIETVSECEEPTVEAKGKRFGKWKRMASDGQTTHYACGGCGGSEHLHGAGWPKRKMICDNCGRINIYPHETASEETSSLWEDDDES